MARKSALIEAYNRFPVRYFSDGTEWRSRSGDVTIDELVSIIKSSACHHVSVDAGHFGLVRISNEQALTRLNDTHFRRDVARFLEKHPRALANISIGETHVRSRRFNPSRPDMYYVAFHWFGERNGEYINILRG